MTVAPISLSGVTKRYGSRAAVQNVDLEVRPGEFLALVGHNGAGKTTLFKLILGLVFPSEGEVRVFGQAPSAAGAAAIRTAIGFLPENVVFSGNMTGIELLRFYARLKGTATAQCGDLLERVGLADAASDRVKTYSKGMRQRLGLAQMLLGDPRLLALDEPTTGLDPDSRRQFYRLVRERQQRGATIVLSSHALADFEEKVDRIAVLRSGRLMACGTLDALRQDCALSVRVRLRATKQQRQRLRDAVNGFADLREINGQKVELTCAPDRQTSLLRRIQGVGPFDGLEVQPPRLEDIYHHFQGDEVPR